MMPSPRCVELVKRFEGFCAKPYLCPAGVGTIGYGHTEGVSMSDPPITREAAAALLERDLAVFAAGVARLLTVPVTQNQFDALVSFAYNVGLGNLQRSTLLRRVNVGDVAGAACEFAKWTKAKGVELPGLVKRRAAERALFEEA
ncbi:MAG: lysozyme [Bryobacteraceae bacterium]|nr:lysozyme [Solibacteraceae bacterium]MCO5352598.1 lysozyme [Bryobacteraceae bacterium]